MEETMFFCRTCGECKHVSEDNFIEYAEVSGTETRYLDNETGDINEYGDSNVEGNGSSTYECPHCASDDIDFESEATAEEAFDLRAAYVAHRKRRSEMLKKEEQKAMVESSDWDLTAN
jgi:hypothetical protein